MNFSPTSSIRLGLIYILFSFLMTAPLRSQSTATMKKKDPYLEKAQRLLTQISLIDGHNDIAENLRETYRNQLELIDLGIDSSHLAKHLQTDIPRLKRGKVGGQFFAAFVNSDLSGPAAVSVMFEQIDVIHRMIDRFPMSLKFAASASEVGRIQKEGEIAAFIGVEGGQAIGNSLAVLRQAYSCGARYLTLTHVKSIDWAEACPWVDVSGARKKHGGLTPFGREVVREMNRLGMLVDLSHVSDQTMLDALETSEAPVIWSHSSARALCNHPRNVPDSILLKAKANGGIVMVNFAPMFISEEVRLSMEPWDAEWRRLRDLFPNDHERLKEEHSRWKSSHPIPHATLSQVADHLDHIRKVAGIDHVGLGSDFDGIDSTPVGLEDVSCYPALIGELLRRGYLEKDIRKLAGENILRVLREAEKVAQKLQKQRTPSEALIENLDGLQK
jgi:membrane dipeptidase